MCTCVITAATHSDHVAFVLDIVMLPCVDQSTGKTALSATKQSFSSFYNLTTIPARKTRIRPAPTFLSRTWSQDSPRSFVGSSATPVPDSAGALQIGIADWVNCYWAGVPDGSHLQGGNSLFSNEPKRRRASAPLYPRVSPNMNEEPDRLGHAMGPLVKGALAFSGLDQSSDCVAYLAPRNCSYVAKTVIASALWCHFFISLPLVRAVVLEHFLRIIHCNLVQQITARPRYPYRW